MAIERFLDVSGVKQYEHHSVAKLAMICLKALSDPAYVEKLEGIFREQFKESIGHLLSQKEKREAIALEVATRHAEVMAANSATKRIKAEEIVLSLWESDLGELFHPTLSIEIQMEIVIWSLRRKRDGNPFLKVFRRYTPPDKYFGTCHLLWCQMENASHYDLLLPVARPRRKVSIES